MTPDILLAHGYFLGLDPAEGKVMRPYPPLGLLYLSSYLKKAGRSVAVFDSTFSTPDRLVERLQESRPRRFGLYANLMTRPRIVRLMQQARELGIPVVVGGPDASGNALEYLQHGASVVVRTRAVAGDCRLGGAAPAAEAPRANLRGTVDRHGEGTSRDGLRRIGASCLHRGGAEPHGSPRSAPHAAWGVDAGTST